MEDYQVLYQKRDKEQKLPKKNVQKIEGVSARVKKKSNLDILSDNVKEDIRHMGSFVVTDVLIPAAKRMVMDTVDAVLYPNGGGKYRKRQTAEYVSYDKYSRKRESRDYGRPRRQECDRNELIVDSRGEAEMILDRMEELIDTYGVVSVADMFDLAGVSCDYTANNYGWTNLRNAEPIRVNDGYLLKMPKALPIN